MAMMRAAAAAKEKRDAELANTAIAAFAAPAKESSSPKIPGIRKPSLKSLKGSLGKLKQRERKAAAKVGLRVPRTRPHARAHAHTCARAHPISPLAAKVEIRGMVNYMAFLVCFLVAIGAFRDDGQIFETTNRIRVRLEEAFADVHTPIQLYDALEGPLFELLYPLARVL